MNDFDDNDDDFQLMCDDLAAGEGYMIDHDEDASQIAGSSHSTFSTETNVDSESDFANDDGRSSFDYDTLRYCTASPSLDDEADWDVDESSLSQIAYLQQKRHILSRAARLMEEEKIYEAMTAKESRYPEKADPHIWTEARRVLSVLDRRNCGGSTLKKTNDELTNHTQFSRQKRSRKMEIEMMDDEKKRQRINKSFVSHIKTSSEKQVALSLPNATRLKFSDSMFLNEVVANSFFAGQQGVTFHSAASIESTLATTLARIAESKTSNTEASSVATIDLEDALSMTQKPVILTQVSPPFAIVHTNGAFLRMYKNGLSSNQFIGKPVESIISGNSTPYVHNAIQRNFSAPTAPTAASLRGGKIDLHYPCEVLVRPVSGLGETKVSHLLIEVTTGLVPSNALFQGTAEVLETSKAATMSSSTVIGAIG